MHFALASFEDSVQGKSVKWHSDNQGPVRIVHIWGGLTQNCILLRLMFSISLEISMFDLFLKGFPESLMLVPV